MSESTREQIIAELKQKHIEFVMSDLSGEGLASLVKEEITNAYQWLSKTPLNSLVDVALVKDYAHRSVKTAPQSERMNEIVVASILVGLSADVNKETSLSTLMTKQEFDDLVTHMAQYEDVRRDLIGAMLKNPIYSELISDVLYHGIKDYLMNENMVAKKVPGVGSLMKMGAKSINKAMPNLENMAEGAVKKYIEANINRTLDLSEKILNDSLDENNIKKVADHFWNNVEDKKFSLAADYVKEADLKKAVEQSSKAWLKVREEDYIHAMLDVQIDDFFSRHGHENVGELAEQLGFSADYVIGEVLRYLPDALANDAIQSYLEERVSANLGRFYDAV